jgi:capsular polysaccharide biosynthesis protein
VNDPDQTVAWSAGAGDDLPERLWALEDLSTIKDDPGINVAGGLVSLGYIRAALRRRARFWCLTTLLGLVVGLGLYVEIPAPYQASTTVLVVDNTDPAVQVNNDIALAQSTAVAEGVVRQLGLNEPAATLLKNYTVSPVSNQVLDITATAGTASDALRQAGVIASQFLKVRAQYAQTQEQLTEAQVNQQVSQAKKNLDAINSQISQLSSQSVPSSMQAEQQAASTTLAETQQYAAGTLATLRTQTQVMAKGSEVIVTPTLVHHSKLKGPLLYLVGALFGGLVLGLAIVSIGAIVSDRLRRRDDVAYAFSAPVRLSVGSLRRGRLPSRRSGAARDRDMRLVLEHLRQAVPGSSRGPASMAIVAVDDAETVAEIAVSLAAACANDGKRIVLGDLSSGAHAARRLGAGAPGIEQVSVDGSSLMLVVPAPDDVAPVGPLHSRTTPSGYREPPERLTVVAASADLVLSLVTLDPASGGEHLSTWATDAVAIVTAGGSSAATIASAREMIRLAGVQLDSVVLIGADNNDLSLGIVGADQRLNA